MSDMSQGPGWWQASDGKWYPPEAASPAPGAANPGGTAGGPPGWAAPSSMPAPGPRGPGGESVDGKAFIKSLYDFQFDHFVTPKVLRFFYAVFVVLLSLAAVIFFIAALASGEGGAIAFAIIGIPIGYLIYLVFIRMYFELISALFRIADDLRAIRRGKGY